MKKIFIKIKEIYSKEGFLKTIKRAFSFIIRKIRINVYKRTIFNISKRKINIILKDIFLNSNYKRLVIFRGSLGWNMPLCQRPQQIANCLADKNCLVLYEANRKLDKVNFLKKIEKNLYLVDYELSSFEKLLIDTIRNINKPKYLQIYSTSWDFTVDFIKKYQNNNFNILYEYIDDLNPELAGLNKLPQNVVDVYKYIASNKDILIVTTADKLYNDIREKRGDNYNIARSSNGVEIDHFNNKKRNKITALDKIKKDFKIIIGYYGAIANWFDYNLLKELATSYPEIAFVLIGFKYDNSLSNAKLENYKNIFYLGTVSYDKLPDYAQYFNIAWIPFVINDITLATSPIKLFEYMALNKFIISSNLPECQKYKSVNIAENIEDYKYYIDNYYKLNTKKYQKEQKIEALSNSWESKANDIINLFLESEERENVNRKK